MSTPGEIKIEVQERGAKGQRSDRRLWMQLQVLGGCGDPKPLVRALEASRLRAALLPADPFAGLVLKPELTMLGRTYSSGFEPDLEDWLLHRPRRTALNPAWPWAIWYPLRRAGAFARLSPAGQGAGIRGHSVLGHAYRDADLAP